jgi:hypothetical protein
MANKEDSQEKAQLTNQDDDSSTKRLGFMGIPLSEAVLLATLSFLAYVLTDVYQAGYFSAFGIPLEFITFTTFDAFVMVKIIGVFVAIVGLLNVIFSLLTRQISFPLKARILQALFIFLLILPWLWFWKTVYLSVSLFVLCLGLLFLPPLLTRRHKGSYLQRMGALDNEVIAAVPRDAAANREGDQIPSSEPFAGSLVARLKDAVGYKNFMAIVYILISAYLAYYAGKAEAVNQEIFFVANTSPETVVLFMTSDRVISAPVDRTTRRIEPIFTITNLAKESALTLRPVKLGPLRFLGFAQPGASSGRLPKGPDSRKAIVTPKPAVK